jgi:hypothetical protein
MTMMKSLLSKSALPCSGFTEALNNIIRTRADKVRSLFRREQAFLEIQDKGLACAADRGSSSPGRGTWSGWRHGRIKMSEAAANHYRSRSGTLLRAVPKEELSGSVE